MTSLGQTLTEAAKVGPANPGEQTCAYCSRAAQPGDPLCKFHRLGMSGAVQREVITEERDREERDAAEYAAEACEDIPDVRPRGSTAGIFGTSEAVAKLRRRRR